MIERMRRLLNEQALAHLPRQMIGLRALRVGLAEARFSWYSWGVSDPGEPKPAVESHLRSMAKGASYRLIATASTLLISFLMTGSVRIATLIGSAEAFAKIILYWGHERIWHCIPWGRSWHSPPRLERGSNALARVARPDGQQWPRTAR